MPEFGEICESRLNQQAVRGRCVWVWTLVWLPLIMVMEVMPIMVMEVMPNDRRFRSSPFAPWRFYGRRRWPVTAKDPVSRRVLVCTRGAGECRTLPSW